MIRPVFGTMRFDMPGDGDYIPAIPTTTAARKDPTVRDNVMSPRDPDIPDWRKRWQFNRETGLLESPFMLAWIDAAEFNEFLGKAWKSHGKDTVKWCAALHGSELATVRRLSFDVAAFQIRAPRRFRVVCSSIPVGVRRPSGEVAGERGN
jgi:hypothetical protein